MSDVPKPKSDKQTDKMPKEVDESMVVNPITMARARHASAHKKSVIETVATTPPPSQPQPTAKQQAQTTAAKSQKSTADLSTLRLSSLKSTNGCLLLSFGGFLLFVGGIMGGLVSGVFLMSLMGPSGLLASAPTPTATVIHTPTPAPASTYTPTPTVVPTATPAMEDIIADIIPSVVTIINQQNYGLSFNPDEGRVVGSGIIIDHRGYIATNHHVIENPGELRVILADGRNLEAVLVISDPTEDLAIVKIAADSLIPIHWGNSDTVRPGQAVYAIGSPLGDFPNSVSFGIVSGLNRALEMEEHVIDGLIQTDAAINRGSSGGPLINTRGEMIGINTFIIRESEDRGVAEGIAFALPSETAKNLLFPWIAAHSGESVPIPASGEPNN